MCNFEASVSCALGNFSINYNMYVNSLHSDLVKITHVEFMHYKNNIMHGYTRSPCCSVAIDSIHNTLADILSIHLPTFCGIFFFTVIQ